MLRSRQNRNKAELRGWGSGLTGFVGVFFPTVSARIALLEGSEKRVDALLKSTDAREALVVFQAQAAIKSESIAHDASTESFL